MTCVSDFQLVNQRIDRILTQYRESPKLIHLIKTYLRQVEIVHQEVCDLPSKFDIDIAMGDQLTLLGKRLGWPRCHCVCDVQPVFGFECEGINENYPIAGFCDESVTWEECGIFGLGNICINDDELYRKFLKVRTYQMKALFDIESLETSMEILFGSNSKVLDGGHGRVVVAPGRDLSDVEIALLQLYPRVLPVTPGIQIRFHFSNPEVFGFGEGWQGFCEEWEPDGLPIQTEEGIIQTENSVDVITGSLTRDGLWMCEFDVQPYDCI